MRPGLLQYPLSVSRGRSLDDRMLPSRCQSLFQSNLYLGASTTACLLSARCAVLSCSACLQEGMESMAAVGPTRCLPPPSCCVLRWSWCCTVQLRRTHTEVTWHRSETETASHRAEPRVRGGTAMPRRLLAAGGTVSPTAASMAAVSLPSKGWIGAVCVCFSGGCLAARRSKGWIGGGRRWVHVSLRGEGHVSHRPEFTPREAMKSPLQATA
jgi:hypothetical protein